MTAAVWGGPSAGLGLSCPRTAGRLLRGRSGTARSAPGHAGFLGGARVRRWLAVRSKGHALPLWCSGMRCGGLAGAEPPAFAPARESLCARLRLREHRDQDHQNHADLPADRESRRHLGDAPPAAAPREPRVSQRGPFFNGGNPGSVVFARGRVASPPSSAWDWAGQGCLPGTVSGAWWVVWRRCGESSQACTPTTGQR
jgi:hypothetical protein